MSTRVNGGANLEVVAAMVGQMASQMQSASLSEKGASLKETIEQKKVDREKLQQLEGKTERYQKEAEGGFWEGVWGVFAKSGAEVGAEHLRANGLAIEATQNELTAKGEQIEKLSGEIKDAHESYAESRQVFDDIRSEIASTQLALTSF
ncbi:hypothetical protein L6R52_16050 [Myxococcota bacterium]|nr:hypothetical protein [Myxococcota bacterium]